MNVIFFFKKRIDIILYIFFGLCTTFVNMIAYWLFARQLKLDIMTSNIIAWVLAVLFAYITNRKWVFHSKASSIKEISSEIISFFGCRLATGIVDCLCMYIFVELIGFDDMIIKVVSNIIVVVLNYVASKLIIFKNKSS